jgi:tetratricopeptide (TPR) repeat protein
MNLQIQILVENNEKTISQTLDSIKDLNAQIVIGNLKSQDKTIKICQRYNVKIKDFFEIEDMSKIRNELSRPDEWNLLLHPWEVFVQGHDSIKNLNNDKNCCYVRILDSGIISKEIRIWKGVKFTNPVCEVLEEKNVFSKNNIIIKSNGSKNLKIDLIKKWVEKFPLSFEPYYYLSFAYLSNRDYKNFIIYAEQYFLMNRKIDMSSIMMRYYLAQIQLHVTKQIDKSAKNTLLCLSMYPTFAEFWCLMGDILYHQKKFEKSKVMYENAIILGQRRSNNDLFPIEINKYKEYPNKMVENINKTKNYYIAKNI